MIKLNGFTIQESIIAGRQLSEFLATENQSGLWYHLRYYREDLQPIQLLNRLADHYLAFQEKGDAPCIPVTYSQRTANPAAQIFGYPLPPEHVRLKNYRQGGNIALGDRLEIAVRIAEALRAFHQGGQIHYGLTPDHIFIHPTSLEIRIAPPSALVLLPFNNLDWFDKGFLEKHLPYISPEQSGRILGKPGLESDLYQLGIILYQLFSGRLPFQASQPGEWLHAHMAAPPAELKHLHKDGHHGLAAVIMKLLAKNPANRYLGTTGLLDDLKHCRDIFQKEGLIELFALGRKDQSTVLKVPTRMFGKEREMETLLTAHGEAQKGERKLVLLSGDFGCGKSILLKEFAQQTFSAMGSFSAEKSTIPYSAIITAARENLRLWLSQSRENLDPFARRLGLILNPLNEHLLSVLPELGMLLVEPVIIPGNPSPESQVQFRQQLISLIKFLSTAAPPLSLILADCQWADEHSIELINLLLTDPEMDHLLLILSMRSQVSDATVWESFLSEAQHPHFPEPLYLLLGNMDPEAVNAYLAHTLNMAPDQVSDLGEVVHEKTGGNPFFLREFLRTIYLEKHLYFSFKKGSWQWQLQEIRTKAISDNVMKMKSQRFTQLSPEIRKTLKVAACLGIEFDLADLVVHSHQSALSCAIACQEGILEGFLLPLRNAENALRNMLMNSWMDSPDSKDIRRMGIRLRFGHLHLKNMVLETLSEKENIDFHLSIAREKYRILNAREMEAELFDLAEHFRWGLDGLNPVELEQVANLFLRAGRKAQENLAYPAALEYYELGIGILGEEHWRTNYTLLMDLHIFGAESAYLANQPAVMEKLANQAILNADNFPDQVRISEILIQAYIAGNNLASAVETGLATLKILNCQFPEKPSRLQVIGALLKMRYWTARGSLESLPDRPPVSDNLILSQMRIISLVGPVAFFLDPLLSALMILYLAELTFTHGPSPSAPIGISSYGILVNGLLRDYDNAKQLATLTERLLKDFRRPDNFSRAIMILNNFIRPWSQSHLSLVEKSQEGYDAGVQDGDLQFAGYGLAIRTKFAFLGGTPLKILLPDAEKSTKAISSINKSSPWHLHRIWHQMLVEFSGEGPWNGHFNGPHFREEELAQLEKSAELTTIGQYYFCHAMLAIWSNNWEESRTHLQSYGKIRDALMSTMENHYHEIFSLLTDLILHKPSGKRASSLFLLKARQRLKSITRVAERVPEPLAFWEAFIRAEIQRLSNHPNMVIVYRRPVEIANKQGYLPGLALLFERLARQNLAVGNNQLAKFFFQESHNAFRKWGLTRNVKRLELEFPDLFEEYLSRQDGVNRQDYQTLVQTLQALSTEIVVSDLLDTLMTTLLESAGADRGLFFTIEENDLKLAAERAIGEETKTEAGREGHHYLAGALRRVWRTRDYLLLEDATAGGDFVNDPYVLSSQPRSLLCLPVFRLSTLIGILYLENHSLPGAFTPQRLSTLQLLAAQAGISLENARLYENLTEEIADRKRLEQQLLQAQKMEAVGRLAGGVAHDFNNILTVIKGYSGMLVATAGDDEDLLDSAKEIYEAGQRAEALTRQLLAFSRKQILKPEIINLNTILDGMQKMLRRLIGEAVVLQTYPGEGLWNIKADPGQIEQVMMNLTVNARDAMGQGGSISIATSNIELEKAFGELPPGEFVRMSVSDTGTGMAPELIEKIFDPFFTTKPKEQGTGLGLSTVYGIVQQSSGTIKVESTPGKGSTFHIWFPRSEQEIGKNLEQAVSSTNLHGIEKILLVEDQREVRDVIGLSLRRLGYDVVEATDGQEGLEKYLEFQEDIQLILTDMIMPNMNGETLIREIRRDRPGLKVIFMSGYTEIDLPASGLMTENTEFMQKPFSPNAAAMKIRQLIDAK